MAQLTAEQQAVVAHNSGHARVVAVAGSGKTTTLTHFISARLDEGISPRRMLVLMYNKAAQLDFQQRLQTLLPDRLLPEIRTFHSLGLKIYQRLVGRGLLPGWHGKLLGDSEMEGVVWRLLQQLADSDDVRQDILAQRKKWVEPALGFIDLVKSGLQTAREVYNDRQMPEACALFVPLFDAFEAWRRDQGRISFADMIYDPVCFFRANPEVAREFGGHMQWLLVDEYQDINEIQQYLLETLHGDRGYVMVIGDPDQTIYEFRGSRPEMIVHEFEARLGLVSHYPLPHTFRYGHRLSLLANHLICHNRERIPQLCLSHAGTPDTRVHIEKSRADDEAATVVRLVREQLAQRPGEDIAVIHRLWALCAPIELAFLQAGIPYQLHHSQSVLERWELQIFWLLLEIAAGVFGQRSREQRYAGWLQLLTTPFPKIRRPLLEQLARELTDCTTNLGVSLKAALPSDINVWQRRQLETRAQLVDAAEHQQMQAGELLASYMEQTDLQQGVEDSAFSAQQIEDRQQTIKAFVRFMKSTKLASHEALAWLRELKAQRLAASRTALASGQGGVHLTSIHKSKGLEWPVVIIPGLDDHHFPYELEGEFVTPASEESERRLLYVAMTRAVSDLYLLIPAPGQTEEGTRQRRSRFWGEMAVEHSLLLGQRLQQSPSGHRSSIRLEGSESAVVRDYLRACGSNLQVEFYTPARPVRAEPGPASIDKPRAISKRQVQRQNTGRGKGKAQPLAENRRQLPVVHDHFGRGRLLEVSDSCFTILFDRDESPRVLNRIVAADMLQWPDGSPDSQCPSE